MAFFELFGRKNKGYASPWLQLTVVYATARDGLAPEHAFALRGVLIAARPIDFEFINPGSFLVFYPGTAEGLETGTRLADALRGYAREKSVPNFGVSVQQGECIAQMSGTSRFVGKPMGTVVSQTMRLAMEEAEMADV